jgi:hypothetical protein
MTFIQDTNHVFCFEIKKSTEQQTLRVLSITLYHHRKENDFYPFEKEMNILIQSEYNVGTK